MRLSTPGRRKKKSSGFPKLFMFRSSGRHKSSNPWPRQAHPPGRKSPTLRWESGPNGAMLNIRSVYCRRRSGRWMIFCRGCKLTRKRSARCCVSLYRHRLRGGARLSLANLPRDFWPDRFVVGQQKRLAQDHGEHQVALKRQGTFFLCGVARAPDDAKIAAAGFHDDVAAAQMDAIFAQIAADDQVAPFQAASGPGS